MMDSSDRDWVGTFSEGGPQAVLDEIEAMIPEAWQRHIAEWPLTSMAIGAGAGVFLGMKKGDEVIGALSTMVTAAATAHLTQIFGGGSSAADDVNEDFFGA